MKQQKELTYEQAVFSLNAMRDIKKQPQWAAMDSQYSAEEKCSRGRQQIIIKVKNGQDYPWRITYFKGEYLLSQYWRETMPVFMVPKESDGQWYVKRRGENLNDLLKNIVRNHNNVVKRGYMGEDWQHIDIVTTEK